MLKTFWGWRDKQHPDGTVEWTSPQGQTYTTHPGARVLFPTLCRPTAPVANIAAPTPDPDRTLAMPRRTQTRKHNRTQAITDERAHNQAAIKAEAKEHLRNRQADTDIGNYCDGAHFLSRPRARGDEPPPF